MTLNIISLKIAKIDDTFWALDWLAAKCRVLCAQNALFQIDLRNKGKNPRNWSAFSRSFVRKSARQFLSLFFIRSRKEFPSRAQIPVKKNEGRFLPLLPGEREWETASLECVVAFSFSSSFRRVGMMQTSHVEGKEISSKCCFYNIRTNTRKAEPRDLIRRKETQSQTFSKETEDVQ